MIVGTPARSLTTVTFAESPGSRASPSNVGRLAAMTRQNHKPIPAADSTANTAMAASTWRTSFLVIAILPSNGEKLIPPGVDRFPPSRLNWAIARLWKTRALNPRVKRTGRRGPVFGDPEFSELAIGAEQSNAMRIQFFSP